MPKAFHPWIHEAASVKELSVIGFEPKTIKLKLIIYTIKYIVYTFKKTVFTFKSQIEETFF